MRIDPLHHLAVEFQNQAQHAVRRRMLRPEVDGEVAMCGFGHRYPSTVAWRGEGREHFRARHVVGLVGEVVVSRLLVDEDLAGERIAAALVEGLRRNEVKALVATSR